MEKVKAVKTKKTAEVSKKPTVKKKAVLPEEVKKEETTTPETNNFWGKLGGWVKEKVDCCLEG